MATSLSKIKRRPVDSLAPLRSESSHESRDAGMKLVAEAREFGLGLRDFLTLAIDTKNSDHAERYTDLTGYEAALSFLDLPVRDDFANGVTLNAASDTFQTYGGTRALFPEVIDDVIKWKYRQISFETTASIVANSRTINGIELIRTVVDDKQEDYENWFAIAELGRIPVKTIRTNENSVKLYKHGGGYRVSYEFDRRSRIDLLTPYLVRRDAETERSKVAHATGVLINGDGVNSAAPVVTQGSFSATVGTTPTAGKINYLNLMAWLVARARAGVPIDTVIGNWDSYIQFLLMFTQPTSANGATDVELLNKTGFQVRGIPALNGAINFALSTTAPAGKLIGISKGDTLEELVEAGSLIDESERAIQNQSITYVKTENVGYSLAFNDTRSIYDYSA